ncbi:cytochrome P450, partial [Lysobacter sp. 2RAB21]
AAQANGGMDAIADLALPFPLYVVSEIIGAPVEARNLLKACAVDIVNFFGCPPHLYVEKGGIAMRSIADTTEYLRGVLNERRRQPRQDLISGLIAAEERGDVMSEDEILATCLMMVFAGFETTTNLVGNGLLLLLQRPDQLRALRADPALMKTAVGEMLRYESPVQRLSRMALEDFELGGHCIRAGDLMFLSAGSANRDELKFADPDRFDIRRDTRDHLAFGHSIHLCPGNTQAQLEAQMLFA